MKKINLEAAKLVSVPAQGKLVIAAMQFDSADEYETEKYFTALSDSFVVDGKLAAFVYAD